MGSLMYSAVFQRDYPTVMGVFLFTAICIAIMGLITDIVYAVLDPRVSYE
jgi:peptide/nickel transport system permease protein